MDLVQQVFNFFFFISKNMENLINMELLKKENAEHEKFFKEFHKCIF